MFEGMFVALVTPFDSKGNVDEEALIHLVENHVEMGANGIVCLGTTGEHPTLGDEEQRRIIRLCVEIAKGKAAIIVGTGTNSSRKSLDKTSEAKDLGADSCLVIVPYYNRPNPLGCLYHFEEIAKADLPMIIYHHPQRTGVSLKALEIAEICQMPEVVAVKECSGDMGLMSELTSMTKKPIFTGDDDLIIPMMKMGAKGAISVMANLIPREWKEIITQCLQGNFDEACSLYQSYQPLIKAIFNEVNPQGIKYAMSVQGLCKPYMRLPLIQPSREHKDMIESELSQIFAAGTL